MRSSKPFFEAHADALQQIDPSMGGLDPRDRRLLAQTELCLAFMNRYLPDETVTSVPYLMMGYPSILGCDIGEEGRASLTAVRHHCSMFGSKSAWVDATTSYRRCPSTIRCFDLDQDRVERRTSAPQVLIDLIDEWLIKRAPWSQRKLQIADPGEAKFFIDDGRAQVAIEVPAVSSDDQSVAQHALRKRTANPPIEITLSELLSVAKEVDATEAADSWPADSLPPLKLAQRLEKLEPKGIEGFFNDGVITLDGATHIVGMLSSGKSTLVMALLLALTKRREGKRIAILVSDTMQGATLSARLKRHAIGSTVLASLRNREAHLRSIHWRRSLESTGWSLSSLGDLVSGFETACPLDGLQRAPEIVSGHPDGDWLYPGFRDKQCHRLHQSAPPDTADTDHNLDDVSADANGRACPLWSQCPAQAQQRSVVNAQVLVMTPQAFVHITPDKWTTREHLTLAELLQYDFDLVIVDEVDSVQQVLDDAFAPHSLIMGDEHNVYAPTISQNSSEALRERSGLQFRKPINAKWQSNFFTFFRLIGTIYAILQNEQDEVRPFYLNTPFTSGSILFELWQRRVKSELKPDETFTLEDDEFAAAFLDVVRVAGAINRYTNASSVTEDESEDVEGQVFNDARFEAAASALQSLARRILVADFYDLILPEVIAELDGPLAPFRAAREMGTERNRLSARGNALALILATVTDLALSHYNWLVRTQPAVARDFKIDDGFMLGPSSGLIKNYRTLLPVNPAGAAFGLLYDEPGRDQQAAKGGKLTLLSHLGVGRHLLTHMHDLLAGEGQAGPHVLMLSGTSWAGGAPRPPGRGGGEPVDCASPSFDVQVPVRGVLIQPEDEIKAVRKSVFSIVRVRDESGKQIGVSGQPQDRRRQNLAAIAGKLATPSDGVNRFERDWRKIEQGWGPDGLLDRRRSLLVTNSYADAAIVAEALARAFESNGAMDWSVRCLISDGDETATARDRQVLVRAKPLPRSLIERFGSAPEQTLLVAPMQVVARGHNILNAHEMAAISSIYFLHRVHPRPDDLGPMIGRLNRFAQTQFDQAYDPVMGPDAVAWRAQTLRRRASHIVRYGLEAGRGGYSRLPAEFKAQFAWNMITPLWQTIGRGIRGGCPVFVGFVDRAFAPQSFDGSKRPDTPDSSVLVQCILQLKNAIDPEMNPGASDVARLLYEPFFQALAKTEGLNYV